MSDVREVSPAKALEMIRKGALLVDVREPFEIAGKSLDVPETLLIPLRDIDKRYREIPKGRQVIVCCRTGSRSVIATRILMKHGYNKAFNMQSGVIRWESEGLPVKGKPKQKFGSWLLKIFSRK